MNTLLTALTALSLFSAPVALAREVCEMDLDANGRIERALRRVLPRFKSPETLRLDIALVAYVRSLLTELGPVKGAILLERLAATEDNATLRNVLGVLHYKTMTIMFRDHVADHPISRQVLVHELRHLADALGERSWIFSRTAYLEWRAHQDEARYLRDALTADERARELVEVSARLNPLDEGQAHLPSAYWFAHGEVFAIDLTKLEGAELEAAFKHHNDVAWRSSLLKAGKWSPRHHAAVAMLDFIPNIARDLRESRCAQACTLVGGALLYYCAR